MGARPLLASPEVCYLGVDIGQGWPIPLSSLGALQFQATWGQIPDCQPA